VNVYLVFSAFTIKQLLSCRFIRAYVFSQQINIAIDKCDKFTEMNKLVVSMRLPLIINIFHLHYLYSLERLDVNESGCDLV